MDRKVHAEQLLANPLFNQLIAETHKKLFDEWVSAQTIDEREFIFTRFQAITDLLDGINENLIGIMNG